MLVGWLAVVRWQLLAALAGGLRFRLIDELEDYSEHAGDVTPSPHPSYLVTSHNVTQTQILRRGVSQSFQSWVGFNIFEIRCSQSYLVIVVGEIAIACRVQLGESFSFKLQTLSARMSS